MLERQALRSSNGVDSRGEVSRRLHQRLDGRPLILASNRGPIEYRTGDDGRLSARRSGGGLVTACTALGRYVHFAWVAGAITEGDYRVAEAMRGEPIAVPAHGGGVRVRFVRTSEHVFHLHYCQFSNPVLWFLQHGLTHLLEHPVETRTRAWWDGYVPTNRAFARAIAQEAEEHAAPPIVMVHDYQLYLVPAEVRRLCPDAVVLHFTHIPWPAPEAWDVLPIAIRRSIVRGLLGSDVVGFQTARDAGRFLQTVQRILPDSGVDPAAGRIRYSGRTIAVRANPISIDPDALRQVAASPEVERYVQRLRPLLGQQTIVRVDRMDPSKNILLGFRAFDRLLRDHPELAGQVKLLAFLVPSRASIAEYRRYTEGVLAEVSAINSRHGCRGYRPIEVFHENNVTQAIAGMSLADVMLVNSVADGMNLVAKEAPVVSRRNLALVMSEELGASEQLRDQAIVVPARDEAATAAGLYAALTMPEIERAQRVRILRQHIEQEDLARWIRRQFADLPVRAPFERIPALALPLGAGELDLLPQR